MHIAITGSSGLIGSALTEALRADGHQVARVVRSREAAGPDDVYWHPSTGDIDAAALEVVDAVVHLAGENVGERWTDEKKRRIRESRVRGTRLLADALAGLERPPRLLVSTSAVGYYGDRGDQVLREDSTPGDDFLARVCQDWEAAADPAREAGIRVVHPRLGVVLSEHGGALQRMLPPFRLGAGGPLGDGRQWMSWVTLDDAVRALRWLLEPGREALQGPVNVTAPDPVANEEFTRVLGRVLGRPTPLRVPAFALRLAFGEMADGALLVSQRAVPERLLQHGFEFRSPRLHGALERVLA